MAQKNENINGSSLTGSDGATNRTYTLANSPVDSESIILIVDNSSWQPTTNFTYSSGVITFLNEVWDDSKISIYYNTVTSGGLESSYYCEPADVKRILRLPEEFGASTNPTETEVYDFIEDTMSEIDRLTRHAWRTTTKNNEYHDVPERFVYELGVGLRIKLGHRKIKSFDSSEGDKLEIWNGSEWDDWLTSHTEGRGNDYWLDEEEGFLHIFQRYWYHRKRVVRVTYRYGEETIPKDIRKACAYLVAADILDSDDYSAMANETAQSGNTSHKDRVDRWEKDAYAIIDRHKEFFSF